MSKEKPKNKNPLENLFNAIDDAVSCNANEATEYLEEEGIDHTELIKENIVFIKKLQAKLMLESGLKKQGWFEKKKQEFLQTFRVSPEKIRTDLAVLELQVNFRNLDTDNLNEEELLRLFESAKFLEYLEKEFPDED
jgi:hypothetical protein